MKKLLPILTIILFITLTGWTSLSKAGSTIAVGVDINLKPFSFKEEDGKYAGFDIDIWKALADDLGLNYELRPMNFEKIIPSLKSGSLDVAIAAITINSEREKIIDFSYPYFDSGLSVMVKADRQDIYGIGALADKVIATKKGTTSAEFAHNIMQKKVILFSDIETAYKALLSGSADAVIYDAPSVLYYIKTEGQGKLKSVGRRYKQQTYGIAFPQESPLREQVSIALLKLIENGKYDTISRKWFGNVP